jgi:hypothetical protein
LAQQAREERTGVKVANVIESDSEDGEDIPGDSGDTSHLTRQELDKLRERQDLRRDKLKQRQRELRTTSKSYLIF